MLKKELYKYSFIFLSLNYILTDLIVILTISFRKLKYLKKISTIIFFNINFRFFNYLKSFFIKLKLYHNKLILGFSKVYNHNFIYIFKYLEKIYFLLKFFFKCIINFNLYYSVFYFINSFNIFNKLNINYITLKVYLIKN